MIFDYNGAIVLKYLEEFFMEIESMLLGDYDPQ